MEQRREDGDLKDHPTDHENTALITGATTTTIASEMLVVSEEEGEEEEKEEAATIMMTNHGGANPIMKKCSDSLSNDRRNETGGTFVDCLQEFLLEDDDDFDDRNERNDFILVLNKDHDGWNSSWSSSSLTDSEDSTMSFSQPVAIVSSSIIVKEELPSWNGRTSDKERLQDDDNESIELIAQPTCLPYAQLCFDPKSNTLVTLMEVHLESEVGSRLSKRLCLVPTSSREKDKSIDPDLSGTTDSTMSIHSSEEDHEMYHPVFPAFSFAIPDSPKVKERYNEPIVLSCMESEDKWFEEADLGLYLLHECQDPWTIDDKGQGGCTEAIKKWFAASRSLVYFRTRTVEESASKAHWNLAQEPFSRLQYTFLQEI